METMTPSQQPFSKWNYICMGACCLLIIIGFLLMLGGGSSVENGFNPDIFSTRRIVVGPLLAFLGFLFMAFAILIDPVKLKKRIQERKEKAAATQAPAPVDSESTRIVDSESTKIVDSESTKIVDSESTKIVDSESTKIVDSESTLPKK